MPFPHNALSRLRRYVTARCTPVAVAAAAAWPVQASHPTGIEGAYADLDLEQLMEVPAETVYGASRYLQTVTQAPASISIVTADEIRRLGHRTLADVLRSVRGLYVTYDRNYGNFGMRGFSPPGDFNTRILLLVDGHRVNDNLYGSALIGTEALVDVDLIERVEIIRGPGSSIYGSSAFLGVINVVTREPSRIDGMEASAEIASMDTHKGRLTYGREFASGLALRLSGTLYDSGGARALYFPEFDTPDDGDGIARNMDGDLAANFLASIQYGGFSLAAAHSRRDKDIPTASYGTLFGDRRLHSIDGRHYVDAGYTHRFEDGAQLMGRLHYDRYSYRADYPYAAGAGDTSSVVVYTDDNYADEVGAELQWTGSPFEGHKLVLGSEYRMDLSIYQSTFTGSPREYSFRDRRDGWSAGVYAQDEITLHDALRLNAGVRYDRYHNFGDALSPRLGVIYSPVESTAVKLLYGEAYRAPNAYEMYLQSPGYSKPNPNLDPESIRTVEAVVEHAVHGTLRTSLSAYHYTIDDLIAERIDPADGLRVFGNIHDVTARGVEFEIEGRYRRGALWRASWALQRAEDGATGRRIDNSPAQLGKLELMLPLYEDYVHAGLEIQYNGRSRGFSGESVDGFTIANLTLFGHELLPRLDLSASAYNLFDRDYAYTGTTAHRQAEIPQDGRTFRVKATYRF